MRRALASEATKLSLSRLTEQVALTYLNSGGENLSTETIVHKTSSSARLERSLSGEEGVEASGGEWRLDLKQMQRWVFHVDW